MIKKLNAMSEIESVKFINRLAIGILLLFLFAYLFLAVFRAPTADETLYLLETLLMSKLISNGEWIGNYGVGVHGFLFKLPVALLFLVTGPSIFVATVFNIFLWVGAGWLFNKSLCRFFENRWWALAGLFLFFASLDPRLAPTFLREHALILCTVLLIGAVLDRRKGWLIGLLFLLLLDAKEYGFYLLGLGYGIAVIVEEYAHTEKGTWLQTMGRIAARGVMAFSPALVYLIFSFTTPLIPVNMFNASLLGGISNKTDWTVANLETTALVNSLANFDAEAGSVGSVGRFDAQMLLIISQLDNYSLVLGQLVTYVYKILHPRTFSLLFIPKIIVLPVVVYSIAKFRSFINEKKWALVYLACMLWAYLVLFIVRASHGRYTFPLVPIFIIFMLLFLIDGMQNRKFFARVFIATVIYISLGQLLEVAYVSIKVVLNVALLLMLFVTYRLASNNSKWKNWSYAGFIILLGGATLAGPTAFMILRGQIDNALNYGIDYEIKDILAYADPDETIWINNIGWSNLPRFVRDDVYLDASFKWDLAEWIPKHATEETWGTQTTYSFSWGSNIEYFEDYANKLGFDKVFIIESTLPGVDFGYENQLAPLQTQDWLVLEETVPLKNKILYVFDVATAPTSP